MAKQKRSHVVKSPGALAHNKWFALTRPNRKNPPTDEEKAWIESYEAWRAGGKQGLPPGFDVVVADEDLPGETGDSPPLDPDPGDAKEPGEPKLAPPIPPANGTPAPKPPRVPRDMPPSPGAPPKMDATAKPARSAKDGDWRTKYTPKGDDGMGMHPREMLCMQVGSLVYAGLNWLATDIRLVREPYINPDDMKGAIVLAVDEMLPDVGELTPSKMVAATAAVLVAQRLYLYKPIKEAKEIAKDRDRWRAKAEAERQRAEAESARAEAERAARQASEVQRANDKAGEPSPAVAPSVVGASTPAAPLRSNGTPRAPAQTDLDWRPNQLDSPL